MLDRLYGSLREARLSPAALDVLSLVAYRQPVTRQEVENLRGVECASVLRHLVRFGLISLQRGQDKPGEVCYSTTSRFLQMFQLRSLEDLPNAGVTQALTAVVTAWAGVGRARLLPSRTTRPRQEPRLPCRRIRDRCEL